MICARRCTSEHAVLQRVVGLNSRLKTTLRLWAVRSVASRSGTQRTDCRVAVGTEARVWEGPGRFPRLRQPMFGTSQVSRAYGAAYSMCLA